MSKTINCGEFTECGVTYRVIAYLELPHVKVNEHPYFSVNVKVSEKVTRSNNAFYYHNHSTGCCHEDILKTEVGKGLKDIIKMHLADINGVPMYAFENGWHFLHSADKYKKEYKKYYTDEFISNYLRIPVESIPEIKKLSKEEFREFVEEQKPRWKKEADEIIKKYELTIDYYN